MGLSRDISNRAKLAGWDNSSHSVLAQIGQFIATLCRLKQLKNSYLDMGFPYMI